MGTCLTLFVLAWTVVRLFSPGLAVAMSVVAMLIPPFAAVVANWGADNADRPPDRPPDRSPGDSPGRSPGRSPD